MNPEVVECLFCKKPLNKSQMKEGGKYCGYSCSGKSRKHLPKVNKQISKKVKELWKNPEYRQHMSRAHKWQKGELSPQWKGGKPKCVDCNIQLANRKAKRCRACFGLFYSGSNAFNWQGGKTEQSKIIRNSSKYQKWRIAIFERDDYTCQLCNKRGSDLQADHIKPFAYFPDLRFELSNGRTLCKSCHYATDTFGSGLIMQRRYSGG